MKSTALLRLRTIFLLSFVLSIACHTWAQDINIDHRKNMKFDRSRNLQVLDLGTINPSEIALGEIFIDPKGGLLITSMTAEGGFEVLGPTENFKPKGKSSILIQFDGNCKSGEYLGLIDIQTNGQMRRRQIGFRIVVAPGEFSLIVPGDTLQPVEGSANKYRFEVSNDGSLNINILQVQANVSRSDWQTDRKTLKPNETATIEVEIPVQTKDTPIILNLEVGYCDPEEKTEVFACFAKTH